MSTEPPMSTVDRTPQWRTMSDEELGVEYSPSSCLDGPLDPYLDDYAQRSADAYAALPVTTLAYGAESSQTVDVTVPTSGSGAVPLHVFIHGGYWQRLSKRESFFLAPRCVEAGWAFAAVDYTLAPQATLTEIVAECVAAVRKLRAEADRLGYDADRMVISGSSAGAQLTTMVTVLLDPDERPIGIIPVSGIYELEPLTHTYVNDAVGMDEAEAHANSALERDVTGFPPTVVAWGSNETVEFKRQSRAMRDHLVAAGVPVTEVEVADRNHFDIVFDIVPDLTDLLAAL